MSIIYKPEGRAGEYANLAVNLYRGCSNGCTYCYAPRIVRVSREEFYTMPLPRNNILTKLENSARSWKGEKHQVLLCFTCDPYQGSEKTEYITRRAIQILHDHGFSVCILTKNPTLALRDLDLLGENDALATTLTLTDHELSSRLEPRAELPHQRILGMAAASSKVSTWASLEPVIDPEQTLNLIRWSHGLIDHYKVGKMNYEKTNIDWAKFARDAVELLERLGKEYLIKSDLKEYL